MNYIYRDSVVLSGATVTYTLCDTVDLDASILMFSVSVNEAGPTEFLVAGHFTDNQTIEFIQTGAGQSAVIAF